MNIVGVQEVSEDKLEDAYNDMVPVTNVSKDDTRGMMKTHNTSFHKCMLCICINCDYENRKVVIICHH